MNFALNPSLDRESLRAKFELGGHIHIPHVLTEKSAKILHSCLSEDTPWNYVFNDGPKHYDLQPHQLEAMTADQLHTIQQAINNGAQNGFQYAFKNFPIYDLYQSGYLKDGVLKELFEFINSEIFLSFIRDVSGISTIAYADAQATAFEGGHFLSDHSDDVDGKNRRLAYVLNMTPDWLPDWGGLLNFYDDQGHVKRALKPTFNALNFFSVPQSHAVSMVTPFAGGVRRSITGWLREGTN